MKKLVIAMVVAGWTSAIYAEGAADPQAATQENPGHASLEKTKEIPWRIENIFAQTPEQLLEQYKQAKPGPIPTVDTKGNATLLPGTRLGRWMEYVVPLVWGGKTFSDHPNAGGQPGDAKGRVVTLVNKILFNMISTAKANVYPARSVIDERDAIILDYNLEDNAWPIVGYFMMNIRDEIRQVGPDLYLGYAFWRVPDNLKLILDVGLNLAANTSLEELLKQLGLTVRSLDGETYVNMAYFALEVPQGAGQESQTPSAPQPAQ